MFSAAPVRDLVVYYQVPLVPPLQGRELLYTPMIPADQNSLDRIRREALLLAAE